MFFISFSMWNCYTNSDFFVFLAFNVTLKHPVSLFALFTSYFNDPNYGKVTFPHFFATFYFLFYQGNHIKTVVSLASEPWPRKGTLEFDVQ